MFGLKLMRETRTRRHLMLRPLWQINFIFLLIKPPFDLQFTASSQVSCCFLFTFSSIFVVFIIKFVMADMGV